MAVPESVDWLSDCEWRCKNGTFGARCERCSDYRGQDGLARLRATLKGPFAGKAIYADGRAECDWDCLAGFVKLNGTCLPFYDASYCRQLLKCVSCVAADICGWCATTGRCLPGDAHGVVTYGNGNTSAAADSCPPRSSGSKDEIASWNYDGCPSLGGNGGMTAAKLQEILERRFAATVRSRLHGPCCRCE